MGKNLSFKRKSPQNGLIRASEWAVRSGSLPLVTFISLFYGGYFPSPGFVAIDMRSPKISRNENPSNSESVFILLPKGLLTTISRNSSAAPAHRSRFVQDDEDGGGEEQ